MSRISVRGFAVASATAVTTVGAVVGVAQGGVAQPADDAQAVGDSTLLADLPAGQLAEVQTDSMSHQATVQAIAADTTARKAAEETARKQAAKDAVAKQKAAEKAAEKAEERAKAAQEAKDREAARTQSASAGATGDADDFPQQASYTVGEVKAIAQQMVPSGQFQCFSNIVDHESTWNYRAVNPSSGAYGLVQAYPGSKMSSAGADWRTNPATQIKWGLNYMNERYGSPCGAWDFWLANHSY
ncbi:aggregation-promoting factor C-terminal-like domain-containing protein [Streptomyces sp. NPDC054884]|uniref:aggregation-promoting factor C-terminal-like domain-containing protein n=1 Tax=unclassified Streptomyces TaxID=2593676 RepID=UPI0029ADF440|nr:transglycosylase SLT domain-containing protein [Streptomyces sp. ME08-AFT2]MDX3307979.1 transglycosylase SLT domain-containing protein [Streptomyces sp. ME08-AFT2]